ncbi:MAG TPA: glycerophosphodiester phosphodiesterase [Gemmatimonadales bacterium]|nr:glycerophosphodiester phosphodiesterase [Gemmatimonadales bacterium]
MTPAAEVDKPLVIAHRGASGAEYENSLAAFKKAGELGADGIELDIHATTDGALIVHHDPAVGGTVIARATAADISKLKLPNGEPVPTLAQAFVAAGPKLRVYVEVKTLPPQWDGQLFATLDAGPNPGGYAVHAFDHRIIQRLRRQRPKLQAGVLSASYLDDNVAPVRAAGAQVLWQDQAMIDAALVEEVHDAGFGVIAWTPNEISDLSRLAAQGVNGLCTNYPDRARRVVDGLT